MQISLIRKIFSESQEIIGKNDYFNSAVLVSIVYLNDEYHFLFEKRSPKIRQGGEVSFPGGEFDKQRDKTLQDTALRETIEELGIDEGSIELLGKMGTLVAPMGITIDPYIAFLKINSFDELNIDVNEVEKVFTIPISYFLKNKPSVYHINVTARPFSVDEKGNNIELLPVKKLGLPAHYGNTWRKAKHKVLVYSSPGEIVWGMTAKIVQEFCKIITDKKK